MTPVTTTIDDKAYWVCACVKRNPARVLTHIRQHHRSVARCARCGITREQSDRTDEALRRDGKL